MAHRLIRPRLGVTLATAAIALTLALALAACGSNDPDSGQPDKAPATDNTGTRQANLSPDEREITAVYDELVQAGIDQDGEAACALMTPAYRKRFGAEESTTCVDRVNNIQTAGRARILEIQIQGNRALATAAIPNRSDVHIKFAKTDDTWKITGGP